MANIVVLPETVQNKIAAGEVIERPASVVKELAENAMDAGASLVAVEMEEGGHRLIRVSDDGSGMDEADLVASLQRHATSKIRDVDDIFRIATFGFRGEALPSIGSVSRLAIATCLPGAAEGREILVEGGRTVRLAPAPPRKGTRIEVRDIFFNTPARRKFLKQPNSEYARAGEVLTRLALGNPGVGFRLQSGDRLTLSVKPAASQLDRIAEIFGRQAAERLVPFGSEVAEGLTVSGYFARPPRSCRSSKDIYILVNRRWIRYPALARVVADAFQGILPPREYPFAVINLAVDPARVDLNVHPTKEEVRFEREGVLLGGVKNAIREALAGLAQTPTFGGVPAERPSPAVVPPSRPIPQPPDRDEGQGRFALPSGFARSAEAGAAAARPAGGPAGGKFSDVDLAAARQRIRSGETFPTPAAPSRARAGEGGEREAAAPAALPAGTAVGASGRHRILGQAGGKYILVDGPDGLLLVDPHALHERWNFDRLVEERKRGASPKRLLLPLEMHLTPAEAAAAGDAAPILAEYGFELRLPGPSRLVVDAAPAFIPPSKLENLLRQVLEDTGGAGATLEAARERLLASLACRSSVLLGKSLPDGEILALLDRFFNQGQLPTCPHGRPTAIRFEWGELARRFGR